MSFSCWIQSISRPVTRLAYLKLLNEDMQNWYVLTQADTVWMKQYFSLLSFLSESIYYKAHKAQETCRAPWLGCMQGFHPGISYL